MFSYETLKVFHLCSLVVLSGCGSMLVMSSAGSKFAKLSFVLVAAATLMGGAGLIGSLQEGMPRWIWLKLLLFVMTALSVLWLPKKISIYREGLLSIFFLILGLAITVAVMKPRF